MWCGRSGKKGRMRAFLMFFSYFFTTNSSRTLSLKGNSIHPLAPNSLAAAITTPTTSIIISILLSLLPEPPDDGFSVLLFLMSSFLPFFLFRCSSAFFTVIARALFFEFITFIFFLKQPHPLLKSICTWACLVALGNTWSPFYPLHFSGSFKHFFCLLLCFHHSLCFSLSSLLLSSLNFCYIFSYCCPLYPHLCFSAGSRPTSFLPPCVRLPSSLAFAWQQISYLCPQLKFFQSTCFFLISSSSSPDSPSVLSPLEQASSVIILFCHFLLSQPPDPCPLLLLSQLRPLLPLSTCIQFLPLHLLQILHLPPFLLLQMHPLQSLLHHFFLLLHPPSLPRLHTPLLLPPRQILILCPPFSPCPWVAPFGFECTSSMIAYISLLPVSGEKIWEEHQERDGSSQDGEAGGKDAPCNSEQHASLQEQQTQRDPEMLTCTKWWGVRWLIVRHIRVMFIGLVGRPHRFDSSSLEYGRQARWWGENI